MKRLLGVAAAVLVAIAAAEARAADTGKSGDGASAGGESGPALSRIVERGVVKCGSNPIMGYAQLGEDGAWSGFMIDFCRAIAAAVLGDAALVDVVPVEAKTRFEALTAGEVDVLSDGATMTLSRDTVQGLDFPGFFLYDGQGFLAHARLKAATLRDAGAASICVIESTTTYANLQEYIQTAELPLRVLSLRSDGGAWNSFLKGRCDLITNDRLGLVIRRALNTPRKEDYVLLPEVISKEPLSPVVRDGDPAWSTVVRWVLAVLITAEEKGVTSRNIDRIPESPDADLAVLTGRNDKAAALGLKPGWARRIIEQVGNYAEIFERNLGMHSPVGMERGNNALWSRGGLLYSPPLR